jgi:hypothetical protein
MTLWGEWGIYPYQQRVNDNTYWCARAGTLTYRDTSQPRPTHTRTERTCEGDGPTPP